MACNIATDINEDLINCEKKENETDSAWMNTATILSLQEVLAIAKMLVDM